MECSLEFTRQKQNYRYLKQAYGYQRGNVCVGGNKSGAWDYHIHITIYKIDNQQGSTV